MQRDLDKEFCWDDQLFGAHELLGSSKICAATPNAVERMIVATLK
jgi:hypothetical protein